MSLACVAVMAAVWNMGDRAPEALLDRARTARAWEHSITFRSRGVIAGVGPAYTSSNRQVLEGVVVLGSAGGFRGERWIESADGARVASTSQDVDLRWEVSRVLIASGPGRVRLYPGPPRENHPYTSDPTLGSFLEGWFFGQAGHDVLDLLSAPGGSDIVVDQESEETVARRETPFGVIEARFDRQGPGVLHAWSVRKGPDDRFNKTTVAEIPPARPDHGHIAEWTLECRCERFVSIDGAGGTLHVPVAGTAILTITWDDGRSNRVTCEVERERVRALAGGSVSGGDPLERLDPPGTLVLDTSAPAMTFVAGEKGLQPVVPVHDVAQWRSAVARSRDGDIGVEHDPAAITKSCQLAGSALCGLYCVDGAAAFLGMPPGDFAELMQPDFVRSAEGSTVDELDRAAESLGLAMKVQVDWTADDLRAAKGPLILHVRRLPSDLEPNHFVLFVGATGDWVRVVDPSHLMRGWEPIRRWAYPHLATVWDGHVIQLAVRSGLGRHGRVRPESWFSLAMHGRRALVIQGLLAATLLTALVGRGRTRGGHAAVVCGLMWTCTVLAGAGLTHMRSVDSWTASPSVTREFIGSVRRIPVEVSELAVDEFIREDAMMRETTTIIDARAPDAFAAIHLPTAINVPLTDSFSERERALSGVDRLQRVVVYCEPFGCPLAQRLAAELIRQHGFKRVVTLSGDWRPWAGMELDR